MKLLIFLTVFCLMSFTLIAQNKKDKESVAGVINSFQNDFNEGDFKNANTYTTDNWVHINPNGGMKEGRDNVLKEVKMVHQSFLKGVTMQIKDIEIRFLNSKVAVVNVVHTIDDYISPDGHKHINERQIKTYLIVKQKGKWLLSLDHNTIVAN